LNEAVKPKRGREAALDTLKLWACFAVIVIHISGRGVAALDVRSGGWLACTLWDSLARFAVPTFLMCTGALMLSPKKVLDVETIWKKYFWKMLRILWFWGWMYLLFDVAGRAVTGTAPEPGWFWRTLRDTFLFRSQIHLYYLQILLLIYACLPVLRIFTAHATDREIDYALGIWLVTGILMPVLQGPFSQTAGNLLRYTMNMTWSALGYALLGYAMYSRPVKAERKGLYLALFLGGFAFTFGMTVWSSLRGGAVNAGFMDGMTPGPAAMSAGLFGLVRARHDGETSSPRLAKLVNAGFCIYLVHYFFVLIFNHLGFDVTLFAPIAEIPLETVVVFALGFCSWWVLDKIPFVKKYLI
jgi:surface polysaccharide O-acyltransferase-like enzyme